MRIDDGAPGAEFTQQVEIYTNNFKNWVLHKAEISPIMKF